MRPGHASDVQGEGSPGAGVEVEALVLWTEGAGQERGRVLMAQ